MQIYNSLRVSISPQYARTFLTPASCASRLSALPRASSANFRYLSMFCCCVDADRVSRARSSSASFRRRVSDVSDSSYRHETP